MQYNGTEIYSIGQNEIPIDLRIDWAWQEISRLHPEFKREDWPTDWNDPYQLYEIVVNNVCGYKPHLGDMVMDIGANIGVFTAYCALNGCGVAAYEPHPVAYDMLEDTLRRLGISKTTAPLNFAIWTSRTQLPFISNSGYEPNSTWVWSNGTVMHTTGAEKLTASTITLADAVGSTEWDCVKMDIEGAEFDVLLDASDETLSRIKYLTLEVHNGYASKQRHDEMVSRLERLFTLSGTKDGDPQFAGQDRYISLFATQT
jgi:FkbM family methyltransferase